ncbi:hypothetical protein BT96DRAFT_436762 [Gymnopus androsaceus JB14]|uniref:Uncharacterized protein n=1 Tax=Gymnopus androsaceus JB14 TaxID=1447944 RepID=A0A6A4GRJ1_9AGAR|nr:hypothetical protein BT96DRAFT_436762 [Gymnopus androsaceus JB14]
MPKAHRPLSRSLPLPLAFIVIYCCGSTFASISYNQCLLDIQAGNFGPNAGVDNFGHPVPNISQATAIPYETCVIACGGGPQPFSWSAFSNQFSAWLLPWLALLSQLPFGANDNLENLISVVLAIGSPVLAAYSAALTVLNGRWIARRFSGSTYPNTYHAVRTLSSLQQAPIVLDMDQDVLLTSLIVLPENDEWWKELSEHLDYTYTWSISAATSIAWVFIAYIFTIIESLSDISEEINVNGQGVGSAWLWLLPVVIAWLQISPKCDSTRIRDAFRRANNIAYVATPDGLPKHAGIVSDHRAIFFNEADDVLHNDQRCTSPIYNYARLFSWTAAVEEISGYFHEATRNSRLHHPVDSDVQWVHGERNCPLRDENRAGTSSQVVKYCTSFFPRKSRWGSGVWGRIIIASILALILQWGTAGAAIFVTWETPTRGLGCRSGSYLLYAVVSTIVWALLLFANILSHYSTFDCNSPDLRETKRHYARVDLAGSLSIVIRRFGKTLAAVNAVWILAACVFQFSSFYDRCWCDSSVLGLSAAKAYNVITLTNEEVDSTRAAWIGGAILASGSAAIYVGFINVFIDPPFPFGPNRE